MKMYLGNTAVNSMKVGTNTDDATLIASDLQSGVTGYARGKKVVGTGKSFEFAWYGNTYLNFPMPIPAPINIVELASTNYPVKMSIDLNNMRNIDFSSEQTIANVAIDGEEHSVSIVVENNIMTISCDKSISLEVFYGKDNYV